MLDCFFGFGISYGDHETRPSVAMNNLMQVFEVHANDANHDLYYRYGAWDGPTITWLNPAYYDKGIDPVLSMNTKYVVEVHNSEKSDKADDLWMHIGAIADPIDFGDGDQYDTGRFASVALSERGGTILEVHQHPDEDSLFYCLATTDGKSFDWKQKGTPCRDAGARPRVAINSGGVAVVAYESDDVIWTTVGAIGPDSVTFGASQSWGPGTRPAVALTEDGLVVLVWEAPADSYYDFPLRQQLLRVSNGLISAVSGSHVFDGGVRPSVAATGNVALHVHQLDEESDRNYFSNALIVDGASWMSDRFDDLSEVPLSSLILPASHDSAMYRDTGIEFLGQTQDLNIQNQLNYGIRWFDLRPLFDAASGIIYMWHGDKYLYVTGPTLDDVLGQVRAFLETHQELVILKFSHFKYFNDSSYRQLGEQIVKVLGDWLVEKTPDGKRLANMTLSNYILDGPAALLLMNQVYYYNNRTAGLWFYRDWNAENAEKGDIRVYDEYAKTTSYDTMKQIEIEKFETYNGICQWAAVACELFLLSWTLTPTSGIVWSLVYEPDGHLGDAITKDMTIPNGYGKIVNLLYVDYAEYARVLDVALWQNRIVGPSKK